MIFLGLGGNLDCETYGSPRRTCGAALELLSQKNIKIVDHSPWYKSAPVPVSDQPWFINGVVRVETNQAAEELVGTVLAVEAELGRLRSVPNAARTIDIDVLSYNDEIVEAGNRSVCSDVLIPHPRMDKRAFVLLPLADIAPDWQHPVSRVSIGQLIDNLPTDQTCVAVPDGEGMFGTEWHDDGAFV